MTGVVAVNDMSIISVIARRPLHVEYGTLGIDGQVQKLGGHAKIPRT